MKKTTRLGCFTISGIMATILTLIIVTGFAFASGGTIFSPGALNAQTGTPLGGEGSNNARAGAPLGGVSSHAEIAGKCSLCHAPFWSNSTMADRCVVCHTDVAAQWQDPSTLHGTLRQNNPRLACRNCHPDHRGPDAPLVDISQAKFPHNTFGYQLTAHQLKADGSPFSCNDCHSRVYTGFDQNICITCHYQADSAFVQNHVLDYGIDCLACHDGKDTYGKDFNHKGVPFKLTDKHALVQCEQCHINTRNIADLKSTSQNCGACHINDDVHQNRLGADCGTCHTAAGWTPASFDHSLSIFKLDGQHTEVACADCHVNKVLQGTPIDCNSCHAAKDTHQGRLGPDCGSCHTTKAWSPANFDHNLSVFKLTGQHGTVACADCHVNQIFQGTPTDCYACHASKDTHQGTLGNVCGTCHNTNAWKPASFNHNSSNFMLTGQHINTSCLKCHPNNIFKGTPSDCISCHAAKDFHKGSMGTNCGSCHSTLGWTPATFNHNLSTFKLTGQHLNANCTGCHVNNVYVGTPTDCFSCHAAKDSHNGQFGTNCGSCHTTSSWVQATFDHNLSSFRLTGAHTSVNCTQCHAGGNYNGISSTCMSCHSQPAGHFGSDCAQCHTTSNWNASYSHTGFPLTGGHSSVNCSQCHRGSGYTGLSTTCVSCHSEPGGHFGSNCAQCHSTSNWNASYSHTGFPLSGGHSGLGCTQCHRSGGYTGLSSTCVSCHAEPGGHFGSNCAQCHSTSNWNASYSHTRFPLSGGHSGLNCTQCHTGGSYTGLSSSCVSCHAEPGGHFGSNCAQCHSTSNWNASYSHTRFPLSGGHSGLNCTQCHTGGSYTGLSSSCVSCHAEPGGHFGSNCAQCHTTSNWNASYSHTSFPLSGGHSGLSCTQCHRGGGYSGLSPSCVSCHAEPGGHYGSNCTQCHSTSNWNASFNHPGGCDGNCANHKHASCADCHPSGYSSYTCLKCHNSNKPGD